jgi:small-conductance mechanosensitive channel
MIYALVQKTEAGRQEALAYEYSKRSDQYAEKQREMIIKCEDELNVQKVKYDVVNNQLQIALKELNKRKSK